MDNERQRRVDLTAQRCARETTLISLDEGMDAAVRTVVGSV